MKHSSQITETLSPTTVQGNTWYFNSAFRQALQTLAEHGLLCRYQLHDAAPCRCCSTPSPVHAARFATSGWDSVRWRRCTIRVAVVHAIMHIIGNASTYEPRACADCMASGRFFGAVVINDPGVSETFTDDPRAW
eukprot:CAMPEP_0172782776 /NCGR_PEP_ID=MMETSP1074-20121228/204100_1 /TAXON_ID=2916 /ORGANISM="Ceratium fusus, Strain PA161109" /LENGTH=134 /DNA_ID=CAMNT_0013619759 /DNA_START=1401 /DNA_END=1805 /DNA_ORIENTATION=-